MIEEILIPNPGTRENLTLLKLKCFHMRRENITASAYTGIKEDVHMANFAAFRMRRHLNADFKINVSENQLASFSTSTRLFWSREDDDRTSFNQSQAKKDCTKGEGVFKKVL